MPAPPCAPDCQCGKHFRSAQHNKLIGLGVARSWKRRKAAAQQQQQQVR